MKEYFLKRALPFMLTFAVGAAVGGFFHLFGARDGRHGRVWDREGSYEGRRGCGKKFRRRAYAPESRPPVILFKPDAMLPKQLATTRPIGGLHPVLVRVTFGEDGKVREVESLHQWAREVREAAERAAQHIQFTPATLDGAPTTVTEVVEIRLSFE